MIGGGRYAVLSGGAHTVQDGDRYLTKLTLPAVRPSHEGVYVCMAANQNGFSGREAFLHVAPGELEGGVRVFGRARGAPAQVRSLVSGGSGVSIAVHQRGGSMRFYWAARIQLISVLVRNWGVLGEAIYTSCKMWEILWTVEQSR